ncbi:MAG: hypothetical protein Hyperionvirus39_10 [Hyperionvirus sp.]|uniref:Uncharacterized protein n=1 Tax=Hyperionvirus sp. TaxID=2487770 RepID=A0A3G5AC80_9VIRU|nr:MAG: hypothetical protein Hyperionvirus39_10 [Hyperionvirus sp.]
METLTDDGRWVDSSNHHLVLCIVFKPYDLNGLPQMVII